MRRVGGPDRITLLREVTRDGAQGDAAAFQVIQVV